MWLFLCTIQQRLKRKAACACWYIAVNDLELLHKHSRHKREEIYFPTSGSSVHFSCHFLALHGSHEDVLKPGKGQAVRRSTRSTFTTPFLKSHSCDIKYNTVSTIMWKQIIIAAVGRNVRFNDLRWLPCLRYSWFSGEHPVHFIQSNYSTAQQQRPWIRCRHNKSHLL